jgi:hypothetical protein
MELLIFHGKNGHVNAQLWQVTGTLPAVFSTKPQ